MNTEKNMEERLWDYIDGTCSAEEMSFIRELIASHQEWKSRYEELLEVHTLLNNELELEQPSLRFTKNVMEEIGRLQIAPATRNYIDKKVIWGIGLFFFIMIAGFLIYAFGQVNWSDTSSGSDYLDMTRFDWSRIFNSTYTNIFMMVNVVLALMLLDMYLGRKKKALHEKKA